MEAEIKPELGGSADNKSREANHEELSLEDTKSEIVRSGSLEFTVLPLDVKKCIIHYVLLLLDTSLEPSH